MKCYRHSWMVDEPLATVILVHGTGEHHGRYEHVARFLNNRGFQVASGDLPGWGRTPGRKGHIEQFDDYIEAVAGWVAEEQQTKQSDNYPVFLLGHSLGGLIAARYVETYAGQHGLAGLVLSSPCLQLRLAISPWKRKLADVLNELMPTLRLGNGIAPFQVSRDPRVREAYVKDPYNYAKVSVRWFHELQTAMEASFQEEKRVDLPVLTVQAGADSLVNPDAVEQFVYALPVADKQFVKYEGLYHEVLNEPEKEIVLTEIADWMAKRLHK
ncbi:MAG: lysophospholipase [Clostridia bacterium]